MEVKQEIPKRIHLRQLPFNTISRTEHMCIAVPILLHQLEDAENSVGRKKKQLF